MFPLTAVMLYTTEKNQHDYLLLQPAMTTWTSTAAYSLITCGDRRWLTHWGKVLNVRVPPATCTFLNWNFSLQWTWYCKKGRTCLMALAPTESMKLAGVQSRMMEWTALRGSRKTGSSKSDSLCLSWLFFCSSATWLSDKTSWVTPSSLYWNQSKKQGCHFLSMCKLFLYL